MGISTHMTREKLIYLITKDFNTDSACRVDNANTEGSSKNAIVKQGCIMSFIVLDLAIEKKKKNNTNNKHILSA
jgi:hypothetical protein